MLASARFGAAPAERMTSTEPSSTIPQFHQRSRATSLCRPLCKSADAPRATPRASRPGRDGAAHACTRLRLLLLNRTIARRFPS